MAFRWVAWTRHQRLSTGALFISQRTGRAPVAARQSSTSWVCSAMWMWMGPAPASGRIAVSSSPVTARRLCGAIPTTASGRPATAARLASTSRP
jgi:hypothetical protein